MRPLRRPSPRPVLRRLRLALAAAGLAAAALPGARAEPPSTNVAWVEVTGDADLDHAFATARAHHEPVLLYWGAVWCPPCNQLRATLFNRQDFAERARGIVAVHLDGDAAGAQRLGTRFHVVGYPTLILFGPDGRELTRLPGEADAPQVLQALDLALASGRPVRAVLADALAGRPLAGADWRLLAFYSWDTDADELLPAARRAPTLRRLAAACPASEAEACTRLLLKSIGDPDEPHPPAPDDATRARVQAVLADPARSRALMDVLTNDAADLVTALAPRPGPARAALVHETGVALARLQADATLSRADRLTALEARVALARLDQPRDRLRPVLPAALVREVRGACARADRETTSPFERQAVITEASQVLAEAGLWRESDTLLEASLSRSPAPFYLMSELGHNARREGRTAQALDWDRRAWEQSRGPATRLQWGAGYLDALVALAPHDEARIEATARQVITEAQGQPNAFYERSARSLQRITHRLAAWNATGGHQAAVARLRAQVQGLCTRLPPADPAHATCEGQLQSPPPHA